MSVSYTFDQAKSKEFKFWNTQPVPQLGEIIGKEGMIATDITINNELPDNYKFISFDNTKDEHMNALYNFYNNYYYEDNNNIKIHITFEYLKWLLNSSYVINDLVIILVSEHKIIGCIIGIPETIQLSKSKLSIIHSKFLCVHKKLRSKYVSALLINELAKRSLNYGYQVGFYISKRYQPNPFTTIKTFYRPINTSKLLGIGYISLDNSKYKSSESDMIKYYDLPKEIPEKNLKKMQENHIEQTYVLLNTYLEKYSLYRKFDLEEFKCEFYNNNIVQSFVLCDDDDNVIDFVSYKKTKSRIMKQKKTEYLNIAQLYYYTSFEETSFRLIKYMMIDANKENMDLFMATNIMENACVLEELYFTYHSNTNYYLWNWKSKQLTTNQIGYVYTSS